MKPKAMAVAVSEINQPGTQADPPTDHFYSSPCALGGFESMSLKYL